MAVTHSKWLAEHALQGIGRVPLVTFETDLEPAERHLRKGYVGLDNLAFGHRLGELAQRLKPQGGRLCILQDNLWSTNQHERLQGIRQRLGGAGVTDQLHGENGWSEPHRCPLNRAETPENAVLQLADLLSADQFDVIISLGMWPVYKVDAYRRHIGPALAELEKTGRRPVIIIATSEPDAAQHALLDEGLVQAYVDMNSREIGRQSYWMLKRLARGERSRAGAGRPFRGLSTPLVAGNPCGALRVRRSSQAVGAVSGRAGNGTGHPRWPVPCVRNSAQLSRNSPNRAPSIPTSACSRGCGYAFSVPCPAGAASTGT
ncbi:substrate-binding domain-containing protein [Azorhizophilus paspali]|uniref:substrate-binding domain-containing protein n=1 Tax=Azorhizophilus paspali TaxID=69963 RepID=UPI0036271920